jgi:hypothetical protein
VSFDIDPAASGERIDAEVAGSLATLSGTASFKNFSPGWQPQCRSLQVVSALIPRHSSIEDLTFVTTMRELTGKIAQNFVLGKQRLEERSRG